MTSIFNIALSGLNAASAHIVASSNNIANSSTTRTTKVGATENQGPYIPQDVIQTSNALGGVKASTEASKKENIRLYDPSNADAGADGIVELPNIDIAEELVKQDNAKFAYEANLKTIQTASQLQKSLIDIFV